MRKPIDQWIAELKEGLHNDRLMDIYLDKELASRQPARYIHALEEYRKLYGEDEVEVYSAPGRSEVGGNHTDHEHGQVLATSINFDVIAVAAPTDDNVVLLKSEGYRPLRVDLSSLEPNSKEEGTSVGLIRGVAADLKAKGYAIGGFRTFVTSDVLSGSGLSSSAAFEVGIGNILSGLYNDMGIDSVTIAIASQVAENVFFGKPCGLMDQMACSVGGLINIDFEDPAKPVIRRVNADFGAFGHSLCIVDTKGSHANLTDEYAAIPVEMQGVAAFFGKKVLREVPEEEVIANIPALREKLGDRAVLRALHFYGDHNRVTDEVNALEQGDIEGFKQLIRDSGNSSFKFLQNVYASKEPQTQNVSIALCVSEKLLGDKGACRVHGGGFAGTIQAFVPDELVDNYKTGIEKVFGEGACYVMKVRKYGGIKVLG